MPDPEENAQLSGEDKTSKLSNNDRSKTPRRSTRERKPVIRQDYISYLAVEETREDPTSMEEAMNSSQKEK